MRTKGNEQFVEGNYGGFGASRLADGICFTFEGEQERSCAIRLYEKNRRSRQSQTAVRDIPVPAENCIGAVRSICVRGLDVSRYDYNYVIDGTVVVDPYAKRIVGREKWADVRRLDAEFEVRSGFEFGDFDWQGDRHPEISRSDMVMYKLHVRGFTKDDSSIRPSLRGTFAGLIEKIPYLKSLGVTTVELMPVYEFEELLQPEPEQSGVSFDGWSPQAVAGYRLMQEREAQQRRLEERKVNYWGYGAGNYFAPKSAYSAGKSAAQEFRELVRALHGAGLECVLEMSFLETENPNYIVDVLRYWVLSYHVDGFHLLADPTAVESAICDVLLRRTKIFALQVPAQVWEQSVTYPHVYVYNDDFLYTARKQINHQEANLVEYLNQQRKQHPSVGFVNFFANNNGFTLADVFAYAQKHNEANGEDGTDGNDWNFSVNCGVEGASRKKGIRLQRERLMRLAAASVILAQGVPLILAGDEFGNSQNGNNNAYCQDNRIGWVNWKQKERYAQFWEYVRDLLTLRREHSCIRAEEPFAMCDTQAQGLPDLSYHGAQAWGEIYPSMQGVGAAYGGCAEDAGSLYIAWDFSQNGLTLALPKLPADRQWRVCCGAGTLDHRQQFCQTNGCGILVLETVARETSGGKRKVKA